MVVRRSLLFALSFVVGYRAAYLLVDTVSRAAIAFPWRESPGMLVGEATAMVRHRLTDPVRGRVADVRAAVGEGREVKRRREDDLRAEMGLRRTS